MSYAFDTQAQVWRDHIRPLIKDDHLAMRFEMLMQEMHDANHKVPSANGIFSGDGINKDGQVTKLARQLDEYVRENSEQIAESRRDPLRTLCERFIKDNQINCPETIYQHNEIWIFDEFLAELCKEVGFYEEDQDGT